ncbi:MAG: hypothetical protein VXZ72_00630 [Chlamydiota bacterium]|nr:hypothetical protein [Chlamydiota bacterium]
MIPGKNQITMVEAEVHGTSGPRNGFIRIQSDGIFIGEDRAFELGLSWQQLHKLLEHPEVIKELSQVMPSP